MMKPALCVLSISLLLLAGCSDPKAANNENFSRAISNYLSASIASSNGYCFGAEGYPRNVSSFDTIQFPIIRPNSSEVAAAEDLGLVGLAVPPKLTRMLMIVNASGVGTYDFTPVGRSTFTEGRGFCVGTPHLLRIENFSEPTSQGGYLISKVVFSYQFSGAPPWAQSPTQEMVINRIFNSSLAFSASPREATATLVLTGKGWVEQSQFEKH